MRILVISSAAYAISVLGMWRMFRKAGRAGGLSVFPLVNLFAMCRLGWGKRWPAAAEISCMASGAALYAVFIVRLVAGGKAMFALLPAAAALAIAGFIFAVMIRSRVSKAFGHGAWFTVGLLLLPAVFYPVIGLGRNRYGGPCRKGGKAPPAPDDEAEAEAGERLKPGHLQTGPKVTEEGCQ